MTSENQSVEEVWLSDVGGTLIGMSRTVVHEKVASFEYMRIESREGETRFIAQPGGGAATTFTALSTRDNRLEVENLQHDFPQRIAYHRDGDALTATIWGPGENGAEVSFKVDYLPCTKE